MNAPAKLLGAAAAASLAAGLALPAAAQTTTTTTNQVPSSVTVPNTGTVIKCNPNGTATVTQNPNATQSTEQTVPGTPVTQNNPSGPGTTTTQTPTLQKPATAVNPQCPKPVTPPATQTMPATTMPVTPPATTGNGPGGTQMDALTNNPNGQGWLQKFDRPVVNNHPPSGKMHHKHHPNSTSGGTRP